MSKDTSTPVVASLQKFAEQSCCLFCASLCRAEDLKLKRLRVRFIKKVNLLALLHVEIESTNLDLNIIGKFTRALNARVEL